MYPDVLPVRPRFGLPLEHIERLRPDSDGILWGRFPPFCLIPRPYQVPGRPRNFLFKPHHRYLGQSWPVCLVNFGLGPDPLVTIICCEHRTRNLGTCPCFARLPPIHIRLLFDHVGLPDILLEALPRSQHQPIEAHHRPYTVLKGHCLQVWPEHRILRPPWIDVPTA